MVSQDLATPAFLIFTQFATFSLETKETAKALDVIELSFQYMEERHSRIPPDELIAQLNYWFRRRGVGYQYAAGQIIKVDSEFLHSEVVKPALSMLVNPMYQGVNAEFSECTRALPNRKIQRMSE